MWESVEDIFPLRKQIDFRLGFKKSHAPNAMYSVDGSQPSTVVNRRHLLPVLRALCVALLGVGDVVQRMPLVRMEQHLLLRSIQSNRFALPLRIQFRYEIPRGTTPHAFIFSRHCR
jgi:hypothetical protein